MSKVERITELATLFPWITPKIVAKHINHDKWLINRHKSEVLAFNQMYQMVDRKKPILQIYDNDKKVFSLSGKTKILGTEYFPHNFGVIQVLTNAHLHGSETTYNSNNGNADGTISTIFALEVDTGKHSIGAVKRQVEKYNNLGFKYILFVSFPRFFQRDCESNYDLQMKQSENLRNMALRCGFNRKTRNKLFFATYIDASNPDNDILKAKIWRKWDGKVVSIMV